jgi:hypothetical protein
MVDGWAVDRGCGLAYEERDLVRRSPSASILDAMWSMRVARKNMATVNSVPRIATAIHREGSIRRTYGTPGGSTVMSLTLFGTRKGGAGGPALRAQLPSRQTEL